MPDAFGMTSEPPCLCLAAFRPFALIAQGVRADAYGPADLG
jgi:hypothetical protein